jgi:hypothetical protein
MQNAPTLPKSIPGDSCDAFTMNGMIPVLERYFDNRKFSLIHNTAIKYLEIFAKLETKTFSYYKNAIHSFYDALTDYDIQGKSVVIWGLSGCNCDAIAAWKGAKDICVVDYNAPICDLDNIRVVTHDELKSAPIKFDYAFSFSTFEHDGLGRYGDPIDPWGDIKAMQCAKTVMTDKGVLFLGVPLGQDALVWNAHRIYGKLRLPLLVKGWSPRDVYSDYAGDNIFQEPLFTHKQPLIVLQNAPYGGITRQAVRSACNTRAVSYECPVPGGEMENCSCNFLKCCYKSYFIRQCGVAHCSRRGKPGSEFSWQHKDTLIEFIMLTRQIYNASIIQK